MQIPRFLRAQNGKTTMQMTTQAPGHCAPHPGLAWRCTFHLWTRCLTVAALVIFMVTGHSLAAANTAADTNSHTNSSASIGMIKTTRGSVTVQRGPESLVAQPGTAIRQADVIITGPDSAVGITMKDNSVLSAGPRSTLQMDRFTFDSRTQKGAMEATLKRGSLSGISGAIARNSPEAVKFKTSSITLGVRGTHFILEAAEQEQ